MCFVKSLKVKLKFCVSVFARWTFHWIDEPSVTLMTTNEKPVQFVKLIQLFSHEYCPLCFYKCGCKNVPYSVKPLSVPINTCLSYLYTECCILFCIKTIFLNRVCVIMQFSLSNSSSFGGQVEFKPSDLQTLFEVCKSFKNTVGGLKPEDVLNHWTLHL